MHKDPYSPQQEREFLDWLREKPSWLSGRSPCEPCHVRRISQGAGMGRKPRLFAVPMTHEEHDYQHRHGELACFLEFKPRAQEYFSARQGADAIAHAKYLFSTQALNYRFTFLRSFYATNL